ncbi:hypothetical protein ABZ401_15660 [Streptomyces sp. NPDC005892]|uniref:hypothetical protein n=1 Tax=Streptomyces sp. NPDC005892 TaxID=3155593 RepID=UPI0033E7A5DE
METLRKISGLSVLLGGATRTGLILVVCGVAGFAALGLDDWWCLLVFVALAVYGALCVYGSGGVRAKVLARAACEPDAVSMRYALVYDPPWGGAALLVVFPVGGDDEVRPEGVVELVPMPLHRSARAGGLPADLPVEPVGDLELSGRTPELPLGVPWIDGRAYWPKRSWGPDALRGEEGRALLARLLAEDAEDAEDAEGVAGVADVGERGASVEP